MKKTIITIISIILTLSAFTLTTAFTTTASANEPNENYRQMRAEEVPQEQLDAVEKLYKLGLFQQVTENEDGSPNFALNYYTTRIQAYIILIRAIGEEENAKNNQTLTTFQDLTTNQHPIAAHALETNIIHGITRIRFNPNDQIRADHFLTAILSILEYDCGADFDWCEAWTKTDELNITSKQFSNENNAVSRGEMTVIILNMLTANLKSQEITLIEKMIENNIFENLNNQNRINSGKLITAIETEDKEIIKEAVMAIINGTDCDYSHCCCPICCDCGSLFFDKNKQHSQEPIFNRRNNDSQDSKTTENTTNNNNTAPSNNNTTARNNNNPNNNSQPDNPPLENGNTENTPENNDNAENPPDTNNETEPEDSKTECDCAKNSGCDCDGNSKCNCENNSKCDCESDCGNSDNDNCKCENDCEHDINGCKCKDDTTSENPCNCDDCDNCKDNCENENGCNEHDSENCDCNDDTTSENPCNCGEDCDCNGESECDNPDCDNCKDKEDCTSENPCGKDDCENCKPDEDCNGESECNNPDCENCKDNEDCTSENSCGKDDCENCNTDGDCNGEPECDNPDCESCKDNEDCTPENPCGKDDCENCNPDEDCNGEYKCDNPDCEKCDPSDECDGDCGGAECPKCEGGNGTDCPDCCGESDCDFENCCNKNDCPDCNLPDTWPKSLLDVTDDGIAISQNSHAQWVKITDTDDIYGNIDSQALYTDAIKTTSCFTMQQTRVMYQFDRTGIYHTLRFTAYNTTAFTARIQVFDHDTQYLLWSINLEPHSSIAVADVNISKTERIEFTAEMLDAPATTGHTHNAVYICDPRVDRGDMFDTEPRDNPVSFLSITDFGERDGQASIARWHKVINFDEMPANGYGNAPHAEALKTTSLFARFDNSVTYTLNGQAAYKTLEFTAYNQSLLDVDLRIIDADTEAILWNVTLPPESSLQVDDIDISESMQLTFVANFPNMPGTPRHIFNPVYICDPLVHLQNGNGG